MSFFVTSDGVNLYFDIKGKGKPIVLVHGWSQDTTAYQAQFEELSRKYKVLLYDHRGHGRSERTSKGLTLKRYALDLRELIEYLNLDKILLAGWSMGASTVFEYVKNFGVNRLAAVTLFDMTPKLINDENWKLGLYHGNYTIQNVLDDMTLMSDNFMEYAKSFYKVVAPYLSDEMLPPLIEAAKKNSPHVMVSMWLAMANNDYREILSEITVPTVVAYGEDSTLYSKETAVYLHSMLPNSKVVAFKSCTHLLVIENPEKATAILDELADIM